MTFSRGSFDESVSLFIIIRRYLHIVKKSTRNNGRFENEYDDRITAALHSWHILVLGWNI